MQVDGFQVVMVLLGGLSTALLSVLLFIGVEIRKKQAAINGLVQEHTVEISNLGIASNGHTKNLKDLSEAIAKLAAEMNRFDRRAAGRHPE